VIHSIAFTDLQSYLPVVYLLVLCFPAKLLRFAADMAPWPMMHRFMHIIDTIDRTTTNLWNKKKQLFTQSDKSVVNEHGDGKDILSILRQFLLLL
jgi:hypothetical protein